MHIDRIKWLDGVYQRPATATVSRFFLVTFLRTLVLIDCCWDVKISNITPKE